MSEKCPARIPKTFDLSFSLVYWENISAAEAFVRASIRRDSDGKWYDFGTGKFGRDIAQITMDVDVFPNFAVALPYSHFDTGSYTAWFTYGDKETEPNLEQFTFRVVRDAKSRRKSWQRQNSRSKLV